MSTRPLIVAAVLAVVAAACSSAPTAEIDFGQGERLIQYVADSQDNVGIGSSVAVNADGLPTISYFGFPDETEEGEVPVPRPIGAPFVPGVLVTSATVEGVFSRGAVQTTENLTPTGINPPYIPVQEPDLALTPENQNGTATVVDEDGTVHVAWTGPDGVSYGSVQYGSQAEVTPVYESDVELTQAGPLGRPGIALDASGNPWVGFAVNSASGIDVIVAHREGDRWVSEKVADASRCNGCPGPLPTGIAVAGGTPTVVFADPGAGSVGAARLGGGRWTVSEIEAGVSGAGLSTATDGERIFAAYDSGDDAIHVATWDGAWSVAEAGPNTSPEVADITTAATDVSVAGENVFVTWEDSGEIRLAQGDGASFELLEIGTPAGSQPSLAVAEDGTFLAWYDGLSDDLMLGVWGDVEEVFLANPSPAPTPSVTQAPAGDCGEDGAALLDLVAEGLSFDTNCLVAPAGEEFVITLENLDEAPHNVSIYPSSDEVTPDAALLYTFDDPNPGGGQVSEYSGDPLDEGSLFFQCDYHPTTMTGTFAVVEGAE